MYNLIGYYSLSRFSTLAVRRTISSLKSVLILAGEHGDADLESKTSMPHLVEIKAKCAAPAEVQKLLLEHGAVLQGKDHQLDHYYEVPSGRLKLRIGNIERSLIFYNRPNQAGPKDSLVRLCRMEAAGDEVPENLQQVLEAALGEWQCVDKQREIYWAANVKLHLDEVKGLGHFVEIEAIGEDGADRDRLEEQCREWMEWLNIRAEDLLESSYSDMLQDVQDLPG